MRLILITLLLTTFLGIGTGFAGDAGQTPPADTSGTVWINNEGEVVRGNWTTGEIIEITTVEEYYWHKAHYDPSAIYEVAPWLSDPFNLARESGGGCKD